MYITEKKEEKILLICSVVTYFLFYIE
jgi:hypothetical protein